MDDKAHWSEGYLEAIPLNDDPTTLTSRDLKIVQAKATDVFRIHRTMLKAHHEAETAFPEPDMPYCVQAALDLIAQGLVAIAIQEGQVVGAIMLNYSRWPWTHPNNPKGVFLFNEHLWVEPKFRRGGTASKLIDFANDVADRKQLPLMLEFSNIDSNNVELRDRWARIKGFTYTGGKFYRTPREFKG